MNQTETRQKIQERLRNNHPDWPQDKVEWITMRGMGIICINR